MWSFLTELNRQGTSIILTTHYLEEAEHLCRNIAIIDHGELVEHTSMRKLLQKLNVETFIVDVVQPLTLAPQLEGYPAKLLGDHSFEVQIDKASGVNALFRQLDAAGIQVQSLRNKANRLEELFVSLVEKNLAKVAR